MGPGTSTVDYQITVLLSKCPITGDSGKGPVIWQFPFQDAENTDVDELVRIFELIAAETVITVDGFWLGTELKSTKVVLDEVITKLYEETVILAFPELNPQKFQNRRISTVLLIRHAGPNPSIPPPTKEYVGRRPWYKLKVQKKCKIVRPYINFQVPFVEDRDYHWSKLMIDAEEECEPVWMNIEDIVFNVVMKMYVCFSGLRPGRQAVPLEKAFLHYKTLKMAIKPKISRSKPNLSLTKSKSCILEAFTNKKQPLKMHFSSATLLKS